MWKLTYKFQGSFVKLDSINIDVSSKMLRSWVKDGRTTKYYLTDNVMDYIREHKIYKDSEEV